MLNILYRSWIGKKAEKQTTGVTVLYGGKSGNSAFIASELGKQLKKNGINVAVKSMLNYRAAYLMKETLVLIVISTHGEGDPPPAARRFFQELHAGSFVLSHLQYSVCALGDSGYAFFCQAGKDIEKRLRELDAQSLFERVDCDIDFRENAVRWITGVLQHLKADAKTNVDVRNEKVPVLHKGVIRKKYRLNGVEGTGIYHLVLDIHSTNLKYQPGDTIGIVPENPAGMVNRILKSLKYDPHEIILFNGKPYEIGDLFRRKLEITRLRESVVRRYQQIADDEMLSKLLSYQEKLLQYTKESDLLDLLSDYPARVSPVEILSFLPPVQPRYYSIASSFVYVDGELHLTVRQIESEKNDRTRMGACSSFLTRQMEIGSSLQFRLVRNREFRLPKMKGVPVIMVATGTGIAPFRAFLQEREFRNERNNWLIFGERREMQDFLYENELKRWRKNGILNRLDLAFSRDGERRFYVQDRLEELQEQFIDWLKRGAYIYVCGSLQMGADVRRTIQRICEKNNRARQIELTPERYMEDLY